MKKITFLFALLCASVMGFATQYCEAVLTDLNAGETAGQTLTFTASKTGELETTFTLSSETSTLTGLYEAVFQISGGGVTSTNWSEWDVSAGTLTKVVTWTTYPSSAIQLHLVAFRDNSLGGSNIIGKTITDIDVSAACGGGSTPPATKYAITVTQPAAGGTIGADVEEAAAGATVHLTATPASGKALDEWIVTAGSDPVTVTNNQFTMPASAVTVTATFKDHDPNEYTAGGHTIHLDASYVGDIYTLVITSADDMEGLGGSFWNVNGASTDMRSNSGTNSYTVSGDKKTITCQVQSTSAPNIHTPLYVLMPGEINFGNVTLNWEDRTPITSEYCNYQGPETQQNNHYYAITWETDPSGNVVITIGNGTGAGACSFRNGGFEGGNNGLANFVVSDDDFATTTPATDYFTVTPPSDGDLEYVMTKVADLPANAKIKHLSAGAIAWKEAGVDRWCFPEFIYTYGGTCNQLDAPTNVAVDADSVITFDAVAGAEKYTAYVYLSGVLKYDQEVTFGSILHFFPLKTATYQVNVVASAEGKTDSDPSADADWTLTKRDFTLDNSEYCESVVGSGNTEAAISWETTNDGSVIITLKETLGGEEGDTHFRNPGMNMSKFSVGYGKEAASNYFNHACSNGTTVTLTLKDPAVAPAEGEKIYFKGYLEYNTSKQSGMWPELQFEYTYGSKCSGIAVSAASNDNAMGTAVVQKAGVDVTHVESGDEVNFIATSANAELYRFVNWTKGGVEVSTNATYVTTITETTNLVANFDYVRDTYCHAEVLSNASAVQGKKLYMTLGSIGGGKYQIKFEGSAEAPLTSLANANYTVNRVTTDIDNGQNMSGNDVPFPNARWSFDASGFGSASMEFGIQDGYTWEDIYVWNHNIYFMTAAGELGYTGFPDRYHIAWTETCADPTKPSMVSASKQEETATTVVIAVEATDDVAVVEYHVVDNGNGIDANFTPVAGEITISGLTESTAYEFTITAINFIGLESDNHVVVEATTIAQVTAPTTAAPTPPALADQWVRPVYSDAYTSILEHTFALQNWGSKAGSNEVVAGDNYILYDFSADGNTIVWGENNAGANAIVAVSGKNAGGTGDNTGIDASTMEKLHLDIWSNAASNNVEVRVNDNILNRINLAGNGWESFDLAFADKVENINTTSVRWMKFTNISGANRIAIDNVYFWREPVVDNEKPVMGAASLISNGWGSAIISVDATDNGNIGSYYVVELDQDFIPSAGQITVTGLTPSTAYSLNIKARDEAGNLSDNSAPVSFTTDAHALVPTEAAPVPTWPAAQVKSLYSDTYAFAPASLNSYNEDWWDRPNMNEGNIDGDHYLHYDLYRNGMIGWQFAQTSIAIMEKLHIDIFSSGSGTLTIRPIIDGDGALNDNHKTLTLVAQQWNSFDVELSEFGAHDWTKLLQFAIEAYQAGGLTGEHISVDNVYFYRTTPYVDTEAPTAFTASLAEESYFSVKINAQASDNSGAVVFTVKNGEDVVATQNAASAAATVINVTGLNAGTAYNLNVYVADEADNTIDPIAVAATTKALPAAAPTPKVYDKTVVPVFSDAIAGGPANIGLPYWGQVSASSFINFAADDKVFFARNFNFQGWDGFHINATGMEYLHVDVFTRDIASINITPISEGHEGVYNVALTANEWTSVDIPLSVYDANNINWADIFQFKFFDANPVGKDIFIDNVYFYKFREPDYTRAVTEGKYGTICLPKAGVMTGAMIFEVAYLDNSVKKIFFDEVISGEMIAGRPYIFLPNESVDELGVFYTDDAEVSAGNYRGLFGSYTQEVLGTDGTNYILLNNQYCHVVNPSTSVGANRAYFKIGVEGGVPTNAVAPMPGRRRVGLAEQNTEVVTNIDNLSAGDQPVKVMIDGQLYILRGEKMYNANGQIVK